jgi:hypothetical protein
MSTRLIVTMTRNAHNKMRQDKKAVFSSLVCIAMSSLVDDLPVNGPATQAGISCRHSQCHAVFSDLDDATAHANECHDGHLMVDTCVIREVTNAAGEIELVLVPEDESIRKSFSTILA